MDEINKQVALNDDLVQSFKTCEIIKAHVNYK
jgi:hypothetical protein